MADLYVTKERARLNPTLSALSDAALDALIAASSAAIAHKYTIPGTIFPDDSPADAQEACVQLMGFLFQELGVSTERLGDWSISRAANFSNFPKIVTSFLREFKTPRVGPRVIKPPATRAIT